MFLFTIESRTSPKLRASKRFADIDGAYVSCYIAFKDFRGAEKLAKLLIREEGWIPKKRTDAWKLSKAKLRTKKDKQYYAEAIKYGYCLVFHMWPEDAPDAKAQYESESKRKTRIPKPRSNKRLERTRA